MLRKLTALLAHEAPERQIAAAIVLGELGVTDAAAVAALITAATTQHPAIQRHAIEALGRLRAAKAMPALLTTLGARDEDLRRGAVTAIVAFQDAAVEPVRERLTAATDPVERRALEEILGRVGGKDAFSALLAALDTTDAEASRAAALAVRQRIKAASARERAGYLAQVTKLLERQSAKLARNSAGNKASGGKGARATAPADKAGSKDSTGTALTTAGLKILGYLEDPAAVPLLLGYAKDPHADEAVRQEAVVALRFTSAGAAAARVAPVLLDIAESAPLSLARTALYSLASLDVPPPLAKRLGALAAGAEPDRALLALERLGQMSCAEAGHELARLVARTPDRGRAEAAAAALANHPEAAAPLATALLETADPARVALLAKLLQPRAAALSAGTPAEKKVARALLQAAIERAGQPGPEGQALLPLARALDGSALAAGLRAAAERAARARVLPRAKTKGGAPQPAEVALALWRRLGHSAEASPQDGYALAAAELGAGHRDEALAIFRQLLDRGFDLAASLRRDRQLDAETRYQIGFHLADQRHPAAEEILGDVAKGGRGKAAQMAKAKLKSAGYG